MTRFPKAFAMFLALTACAPVPQPAPEPAAVVAAPVTAPVAVAPAAEAAPVAEPLTSCNHGFTLKDGKCVFTGFGNGSSGTSWN